MTSAAFTINGTQAPAAVAVAYGATVTFAATDLVGAQGPIEWTIIGSSKASYTNPTITPAGIPTGSTATCTQIANPYTTLGASFVVECTVRDSLNKVYTQRGVFGTPNNAGIIPIASAETADRHTTHGWIEVINNGLTKPVYDVAPLTTNSDDTAIIQAAINSVGANGGGVVLLGPNHAVTAGSLSCTYDEVIIQGRGGGTIIAPTGNGDVITFSGCQRSGIRDVTIWRDNSASIPTSGAGFKFYGTFLCTGERIRVICGYNGIDVEGATETWIRDFQLRGLFGPYGIKYTGIDGGASLRLTLQGGTCDCPYALTITDVAETWQDTHAYVIGDTVYNDNKLYQCSFAGTSTGAGGGPTGVPGSTVANSRTTEIVDGTAKWIYLCNELNWIYHGSYAATLVASEVALLNGFRGWYMCDPSATGSSKPQIGIANNIEIDHPYSQGVLLEAGFDATFSDSWISSVRANEGLWVASTFGATVTGAYGMEWSVYDTRIFASAKEGVRASTGWGVVSGCRIASSGTVTASVYDGILVDADVSYLQIHDNHSGGGNQNYGVRVATGASDHYIITNNLVVDNATGGVEDDGTGVNKTVSGNTI